MWPEFLKALQDTTKAQDSRTDRLSREDERRKMAEWFDVKCQHRSHGSITFGQRIRRDCKYCVRDMYELLREGRAPWDVIISGQADPALVDRISTQYACPGNSDGVCDATDQPCNGRWNGLHCIKITVTYPPPDLVTLSVDRKIMALEELTAKCLKCGAEGVRIRGGLCDGCYEAATPKTHYVGDDCPGGHYNDGTSAHLVHGEGTHIEGTHTCCLCGYQGIDVNRLLPDRSWPKGSIMPEYACDSPQWCAERAKGKQPGRHTCYYCNHEGTDVNRIHFAGGKRVLPSYCCDDGDACDARIKETA